MPNLKKRVSFFESEEGLATKRILERIETDTLYNTASSYSANTITYSDNLIPFVDKHMNYLNSHPNVNLDQYLANLRLITKIR
ncbi:hypothetical protein COY17_02175 [Candidatus Saccharibacteria bacterium CG_4_10_14_0_2_um_filter_52_9]|nr:MAG: hypothetical protein COY17_02175 [Candidatus Saccharibacteria bacterium CG_4_10_14_0_2_um_filter_52_9]